MSLGALCSRFVVSKQKKKITVSSILVVVYVIRNIFRILENQEKYLIYNYSFCFSPDCSDIVSYMSYWISLSLGNNS